MPKNPPKLITAYATWPERLLTMKLYTVPSRSPWRLYTAVPSTLLDAISSPVSSVATEPAVVVPLVPEPMPDVLAMVASLRCHQVNAGEGRMLPIRPGRLAPTPLPAYQC